MEPPEHANSVSKVPLVTLMFWAIKICATTVGETGGDAVSMTLQLGYAVGSLIFLAFFGITVSAQVASKRYRPFLYWAVVVATTTVGTTMSDYLDRTVGLGYVKSSIMLFCGVIIVLVVWRRVTGAIQFENITTKKNEVFYWITILVSNTLGTALGDFVGSDWAWSPCLCRSADHRGGGTLFDKPPSQRALLGRIYSDAASRGHARRHTNQVPRRRWSRTESHYLFAGYCGAHDRGDNRVFRKSRTVARPFRPRTDVNRLKERILKQI